MSFMDKNGSCDTRTEHVDKIQCTRIHLVQYEIPLAVQLLEHLVLHLIGIT